MGGRAGGNALKYGLPVLSIRRIEDCLDASRTGGYILSVPSAASMTASLDAARDLSRAMAPLLILGRADKIDADTLTLAGAALVPGAPLVPKTSTNATVTQETGAFPVSLGDLIPVHAVGHGKVLVSTAAGHPMVVENGTVMWAQLNDWANPGSEDLSLKNLGSGRAYAAVTQHMRATHGASMLSSASAGIDAEHHWPLAPLSAQMGTMDRH